MSILLTRRTWFIDAGLSRRTAFNNRILFQYIHISLYCLNPLKMTLCMLKQLSYLLPLTNFGTQEGRKVFTVYPTESEALTKENFISIKSAKTNGDKIKNWNCCRNKKHNKKWNCCCRYFRVHPIAAWKRKGFLWVFWSTFQRIRQR